MQVIESKVDVRINHTNFVYLNESTANFHPKDIRDS